MHTDGPISFDLDFRMKFGMKLQNKSSHFFCFIAQQDIPFLTDNVNGSTNCTSSSQTFEAGSTYQLSDNNDCDNISDSESDTEENETGHSDPLFEQMMQIPFHVPVSDLSDSATTAEEHASALKDSLITYAKSNFNRARITEVTFESAKNFCQQLGKIESVKFHLEKCIIGSEIQEREDIRVSKHVLRATFSFSKSTECVIVENFKESKLKEKAVIPFRSFLGVYVNKATKTVAGYLSFQPGRYQYDSDTREWSKSSPSSSTSESAELPSCIRISLIATDNQHFGEVLSTMRKNKHLEIAILNGIKMDGQYQRRPHHNRDWTSPDHKFRSFPIVHDPLLCRAAQLASLSLLDEAKSRVEDNKLVWLLKMFRGVSEKFQDLIVTRAEREA